MDKNETFCEIMSELVVCAQLFAAAKKFNDPSAIEACTRLNEMQARNTRMFYADDVVTWLGLTNKIDACYLDYFCRLTEGV